MSPAHLIRSLCRHPQQEVIESALQGNDNLLVMATGAGKSLCMQVGSTSTPRHAAGR